MKDHIHHKERPVAYACMVRRLIKAGMLPGKALELVAVTYKVNKKDIIKVLEE